MDFLGFLNTLLANYSIIQLVQLAGLAVFLMFAAVIAVWGVIRAVVYLVRKSRIEKIGPLEFDPEDEKPIPKRRARTRKVVK